MKQSLLDAFKIYGLLALGAIIAIIVIVIYLTSGKPRLRQRLREQMLRALHKDGECEILSERLIAETLSGEWFEAQQMAAELIDEGLVIKEKRHVTVRNAPQVLEIYILTSKGNEEVVRLFGPRSSEPS